MDTQRPCEAERELRASYRVDIRCLELIYRGDNAGRPFDIGEALVVETRYYASAARGKRKAESGERRAERRVRMIVAKQSRSADKFYCFSPAAIDQILGGGVFETHHLGSNLQGKRLRSFRLEHFPRSLLGVLSTVLLSFVFGLELHWRSLHLREPNSDEDTMMIDTVSLLCFRRESVALSHLFVFSTSTFLLVQYNFVDSMPSFGSFFLEVWHSLSILRFSSVGSPRRQLLRMSTNAMSPF